MTHACLCLIHWKNCSRTVQPCLNMLPRSMGSFQKCWLCEVKVLGGSINFSIFGYLLFFFGKQIICLFWQFHLWALQMIYLGRLRLGVCFDQVSRTQRCITRLHCTDQLRVPKVYSDSTVFLVKVHFYDSGNSEIEMKHVSALISCPIIIILYNPRRHLENVEELIPNLKWSICICNKVFCKKRERTLSCPSCCCSVSLWKQ